jgi:hypothetical protein
MYLLHMEQVAREDIAAAAAARRELGSSYDDAFADSLIERMGAEIDKRVDARLAGSRRLRRADVGQLERRCTLWKGVAIGAAPTGLLALMTAMRGPFHDKGVIAVVILLWVGIAAGYINAKWAHMRRQLDDRGN